MLTFSQFILEAKSPYPSDVERDIVKFHNEGTKDSIKTGDNFSLDHVKDYVSEKHPEHSSNIQTLRRHIFNRSSYNRISNDIKNSDSSFTPIDLNIKPGKRLKASKVSDSTIKRMKTARQANTTYKDMSDRFGMSYPTLKRYLNRKEQLTEMPAFAPDVPKDYISDDSNEELKQQLKNKKPVSSTETHDIFRRKNDMDEHEYHAVNKKTGNVDMVVSGEKSKSGFNITGLSGRKGSGIKAPDLYQHINNHHEPTINSDRTLSKGGVYVWRTLHDRGANISHFNDDNKKIKLHTGDSFHKNFETDEHETSYFQLKRKK